jgi:hypothetical protein
MCLDPAGRQAPPLQGFFIDVIQTLMRHFKSEEVKWIFMIGDVQYEMPFSEWFDKGKEISNKDVTVKSRPLDEKTLGGLVPE